MSEVMNKQFRSGSPTISFKSMQVSETQVDRVAASTMYAVRIRTLKSYTYAEFMLSYFKLGAKQRRNVSKMAKLPQ